MKLIKSHVLMKIDMNWYGIGSDPRFFQKNTRSLGWILEHNYIEQSSKNFNALYVFLFEIKLFRNFTPNKITIMLYKSYNSHTFFFFFFGETNNNPTVFIILWNLII